MRLHLGVGVGYRVGHVHLIPRVLKGEIKWHLIVRPLLMLVHLVDLSVVRWDLVLHILPALEPASAGCFPCLCAPEWRFHSIVEQTVTFGEVDNIDTHLTSEVSWGEDAKVKPLQIIAAVRIVSYPDIKCFFVSLSHLIDVSTLKVTVKCELGGEIGPCSIILFTSHFNRATNSTQGLHHSEVGSQKLLVFLPIDQLLVAWVPDLVKDDIPSDSISILHPPSSFWNNALPCLVPVTVFTSPGALLTNHSSWGHFIVRVAVSSLNIVIIIMTSTWARPCIVTLFYATTHSAFRFWKKLYRCNCEHPLK